MKIISNIYIDKWQNGQSLPIKLTNHYFICHCFLYSNWESYSSFKYEWTIPHIHMINSEYKRVCVSYMTEAKSCVKKKTSMLRRMSLSANFLFLSIKVG